MHRRTFTLFRSTMLATVFAGNSSRHTTPACVVALVQGFHDRTLGTYRIESACLMYHRDARSSGNVAYFGTQSSSETGVMRLAANTVLGSSHVFTRHPQRTTITDDLIKRFQLLFDRRHWSNISRAKIYSSLRKERHRPIRTEARNSPIPAGQDSVFLESAGKCRADPFVNHIESW